LAIAGDSPVETEQRAHRVQQRSLAGAVLARNSDDFGIQRNIFNPLPVISMNQFK
jgi:hypothetical protein